MPAFVLGNSPYLPVDDLWRLEAQFSIGVNRILRSGFTPTVLLWVDHSVYGDDGKQIDESGALLVCDASIRQRQYHIGLKTWVGDAALKHESTPTQLCVNANTGVCAARWALALGCRPVYLLGMEARYQDGRTNFYGDNRWHHRTAQDPGTVLGMTGSLRELMLSHERDLRHVPDGEALADVVEGLPEIDQEELRCSLRTLLSGSS